MRRLSYEEVKEKIEKEGYKLLSNAYKNNQTKLLLRCPFGHEFKMRYANFQQGQRCPYCQKCVKLTYEEVKEYIESFRYKLLSKEYINNLEKLDIMCPEGHEFKMCYSNFQQGRRCTKCKGHYNYNYNEVKIYIESFGYKLLSTEYKNNHTKLDIMCENGHIFKMDYGHFKNRGQRCTICNISKGERRIMDWLEDNSIEYIYDSPYFEDLFGMYGRLLRPDFIIEDKKIWIEFDGEFHYKKYYENDGYERFIIHDRLKDEYAERNNWRLIRIPYWEFDNIEEILNKEINNRRQSI